MVAMTSLSDAPFHWCSSSDQLPSLGEVAPLEWEEFHRQRNAVLGALRPFGSVGPLGDYPLAMDTQAAESAWSIEAADPTFYVLDDLLGPLVSVEVRSSAELRPPVLEALWAEAGAAGRVRVGIAVPRRRYFFLDGRGVWFLDLDGTRAASLGEALGLPVVTAPAA
jgi:hypothetical protein